jgi:hypothetical protein
MTDRELLEFAAKAAGGLARFDISPDKWPWLQAVVDGKPQPYPVRWNPLTDDGDALRLAVQLELSILLRPYRVEVTSWLQTTDVLGFGIPPTPRVKAIEPYGTDPHTATRRAIVRAAAEIGRSRNELPPQ